MRLKGSVVVVTGATGGIGRVIAGTFLAGGAKTVLVDISSDVLHQTSHALECYGGQAIPLVCDITQAAQVQAMTEKVRTMFGSVDILINNAGSLTALGPLWEVDPVKWIRDVTVNLLGTFLVTRAIVPSMLQDGGYVISLFGAGVDEPQLYTSAYDCSKTAVVRLMETLGKEGQLHGLKAFALRPGPVRTAMTEFILQSSEGRKWRPGFADVFAKGQDVAPQRAADWCLRLVSGEADQLTGRWFDAREDFEQTIRLTQRILDEDQRVLRAQRNS